MRINLGWEVEKVGPENELLKLRAVWWEKREYGQTECYSPSGFLETRADSFQMGHHLDEPSAL